MRRHHRLSQCLGACLVLAQASGSAAPVKELHWAFAPIQKVATPEQLHPVDALIDTSLATANLQAAPPAEPRTLIRRLTFDLTGLPPTPAEITRFEAEHHRAPGEAWQRLIDRLLDSPRYGERWGQHWLDLVRYADTAGDAADYPVPEAYKYRNYVIASFNQDKPYNQFIREQIAGDLLPFKDDDQRWEQTIGTGYVAISRRIGVSPHNQRHIMIEDTLDNLGKTFLGLTIGCARCHDHKFDAISMKDYYGLYGFFESSVFPHAGAEHKPWRGNFVYRIGKKRSDELLKDHRAELARWNRREREVFEIYRRFQREKVTDPTLTRASTFAQVLNVRAERAAFAKTIPDLETAYALADGSGRDVSIQKAGNPRDKGGVAPRGFLQILGGQQLSKEEKGSGRAHLANWIADPKNPLTARVMVNRVWQHHFGEGLVGTPSDFGIQGDAPTHPRLLDHLAGRFIKEGWSLKALHRHILTSRAYRRSSAEIPRSSAMDPENRLLWRFNRIRLDAEQLRDTVLLLSGQLDLEPGGRHPFPHRLTYFFRQHDPFQEVYPSNKRSVYLMRQRIQKNPYLDLFDGPDGNTPLENRPESNTALQALYFMNSAFAHEQANALATRLLTGKDNFEARLRHSYETIFNRPPTEEDLTHTKNHLEHVTRNLGQSEHRAWSGLLRGMISSNEFMFVD